MGLCGNALNAKPQRAFVRAASSPSPVSVPLKKWLILLHFWVRQYPVKDAAEDSEVDKNTACDVYQWFREVCSTKLLNTTIFHLEDLGQLSK